MNDGFAVFILTNRRSEKVYTYKTLKRGGYTGAVYLLVDDEDPEKDNYLKKYKDEVIIFNKQDAVKMTDSGNNFGKTNSVVFARNINFIIAKEMGLKYFLQLDDDYSDFGYVTDGKGNYVTKNTRTKKLDDIFKHTLKFLEDSGASSVAFSQGGDFIGGKKGNGVRKAVEGKFLRKAMNSFFISTARPFKFVGMMNDDVNTFISLSKTGNLFCTFLPFRLWQRPTQSNEGGLTEMYLEMGTYVKSFYTVMYEPSCTTVVEMGSVNRRLHHKTSWKYAAPVILDEKFKKVSKC